MEIEITDYNDLLTFVKRADVSPANAVTVFGKACNVVCISFVDAITRKTTLSKQDTINKIESFISEAKEGKKPHKVVLFT